ncbi:MAG TPA: AEC family transporter [Tenuifilaceae bacterium]|nr:AEC family transporter [Tenuifilaceae bacterium]
MGSSIIIHQILIFGLLMLIGVIAKKAKVISEEGNDVLSRVIIDITLPALILTTFLKLDYNAEMMLNGVAVFCLAYVNLLIMFLIGTISSRTLKLNPSETTVHTLHTMFGNIVFLGYPLLDALFPGGLGVFYAAAYQLASNSITYTYGIYRLSSGNQKGRIKRLFNINTIALILGFTLMMCKVKIPGYIVDGLNGLGKVTSPLSMVYIGALLAGMSIKNSFKTTSIYVISFTKLLLIPILLALTYKFALELLGVQVSTTAFSVLIMEAAMPCQTIVVVMSRRYNGEYKLAAGNLFVTTVLSIFTLPLIYRFLEYIMNVTF